jgi:HAE1 family hydrophobic/amphiphilic exporter-1
MYRTGTSLNIMSLGGLALGVGMLVDSSIVVLEAIVSKREAGASAIEAAAAGTAEVGRAVIASTLTTVAVFLPVVFLEGIAAQLFRDMALTVSFALLASTVVSLTLIPMLAALSHGGAATAPPPLPAEAGRLRRALHRITVTTPVAVLTRMRRGLAWLGAGIAWLASPLVRVFDGVFTAVERLYPRLLDGALANRTLVIALAAIAFAGAAALAPHLGVDLIPDFAQGEFGFSVTMPEGVPLEVTDRVLAEAGQELEDDPAVESFSTIAGGAGLSLAATGAEGENTGRLQVRLAPGVDPGTEAAVIARLRSRLEADHDARFDFERTTHFSFHTPIEVEVYSDTLDDLHLATRAIEDRLRSIPGLVDVRSTVELGNPEVQVHFDRDQLAKLGLDLATVAETVRTKIQGDVATRFTEGEREIDIRVRALAQGGAEVEDIDHLIVGRAEGRPIFLKSVADIAVTSGPTEIRRIHQKRAALVSGNLAHRDMGAVAADVRRALHQLEAELPVSVTARLSGQEEELERSFSSLARALALAIFLVYLVMASQFESFFHPFVIIFTLPLGAIGVIAALALTGQTVNVVAIIGAVMLAGIVVNNAIVLIDAVNQRRRDGSEVVPAIVEAGRQRLRPILMTSATTVFGLLPMAIGLGEGAELRAPLAVTVIGGLSVATLLTLVIIPVVYALLSRAPARRRATAASPAPAAGTPGEGLS